MITAIKKSIKMGSGETVGFVKEKQGKDKRDQSLV